MISPRIALFSEAALEVLDRQVHDTEARGLYDLMAGGLVWPDEFPRSGSPDWWVVASDWGNRALVGYRASLTLRAERAELRPVWEQVARDAPNWPGLRADRQGVRARRRLRAAQRREVRCVKAFEAHFREGKA